IVYLSPDWSAFERREGAGNLWRPSGRFSAPELAPEFDATELTFETTWKRVDGEETALKGKDGENAENSEGETTVVGVLQGLIGGDFRVWTLPLRDVASENGGIGEEGEDKKGERGEQAEKKRETAASVVDFPGVFQSGDAVATVGETTINANGETTARVRFDFAEAFDAFDSHRVWCDERDFALIVEPCGDEADAARGENATRTREEENGIIGIIEKKSAVAINGKVEAGEERTTARLPEIAWATAITEASGAVETGAEGPRWEPIRWRVRERSANGALFELDFPDDAALREAVAEGRARLACRIPRFFFWTRIEIGGIETRLDGGEVGEDEETAAKGAVKGEND
ncbi:MAG: hypothetical protein IKY61_01225, partial [Thermoguttaceae bacterium]|nr:hypothetical protein [Thermoguttaceae bacterium]